MSEGTGILYGVLAHPGHNRVYYEASIDMSLAELEIARRCFSVPCREVRLLEVEGLRLYAFLAETPLAESDLSLLSRLSFVYALFQLEPRGAGYVLLPIRKRPHGILPEDLGTILKYTGKTNELFTRLMLNVGILSGAYAEERHIQLLDPLAGKGTTLFEAAINGWDAYGVEITENAVQDARVYFKKYLETGKYKHTLERERISGEGRRFRAEFSRFAFAESKEAVKAGRMHHLVLVEGDSRYTNHYFKHNHFHLIVADLPYGVQHGSHHPEGAGSPSRNPDELIRRCLPAWMDVLKPGGTVVLAWNRFVLEREVLSALLREKGLHVLDEPPYDRFLHRVDQAIQRDLLVARKE